MSRTTPRRPHLLPQSKQRALRRAARIEWLTLLLRLSVVGILYAALGNSQALTAIWLKSLWALLPPIAFLAACRLEQRGPTPRFPYGFYRAASIAFLSSALALTCMGLYLVYAGLRSLLHARHPSLAAFGQTPDPLSWKGWLVIAALLYSMAVPFVAGGSRQKLAIALHDKGLYADATMGRASWRAGGAAIIGVLGIGFGLWWADFIATLVIGADILYHGYRHLRTAVCDLIDEVPRRIDSAVIDPLGAVIRDHLESLDWVADARVRLREEGRLITGVGFVYPRDEKELIARLNDACIQIEQLDWRLLDFELIPVDASHCSAMVG